MRLFLTTLQSLALVGLVALTCTGGPPLESPFPGGVPELFAPGVVNTHGIEINLVLDRGYTEIFFSRMEDELFSIYTSRLVDGSWTNPERLELYPEGTRAEAVDMALSPDEQSLYFLGITYEGDATQSDIWVSERSEGDWSLARRLSSAVNTEHGEFYPTVTADGSLYFVSDRPSEFGSPGLYRAAHDADGGFEQAVLVPVDTQHHKGDTFVAPDESYVIFSCRDRGGYGFGYLFISYRTTDVGWTEPKNMGPQVNGADLDFCPMLSPDGKWFSFSRRYGVTWSTTTDAEIYWMNSSIIEELRLD